MRRRRRRRSWGGVTSTHNALHAVPPLALTAVHTASNLATPPPPPPPPPNTPDIPSTRVCRLGFVSMETCFLVSVGLWGNGVFVSKLTEYHIRCGRITATFIPPLLLLLLFPLEQSFSEVRK
ncbi:unnamed protein product [Arctogadus glacialis]